MNIKLKHGTEILAYNVEVWTIPRVGEWIVYEGRSYIVKEINHQIKQVSKGYIDHQIEVVMGT